MLYDHLIHCIPDVRAAAAAYEAGGMPVTEPVEDSNGQLRSGWWDGMSYIELAGAGQEALADNAYGTFGELIAPRVARLRERGGGPLCFGVEVEDVDAELERIEEAGIATRRWDVESEFDGRTVRYTLAWAADGPEWLPFLIQYGLPRAQRETLIGGRRPPANGTSFAETVVTTPDVRERGEWLTRLWNCDATELPGGDVRVELAVCAVRLTPGDAEAISAVRINGIAKPFTVAGLALEPATS
jgi:Glyoxalase-like domain